MKCVAIKVYEMKTFEEFVKYLRDNKVDKFTFKDLSEGIHKELEVPICKTIFWCRMLRELNMIEKKTLFNAVNTTPLNYWKLKK